MPQSYREHLAPAALQPVVACLWEHTPSESHRQPIVPDGCVDLIWLVGPRLAIAGPDTGPRTADRFPAGSRSSGIRLRPGAAGAVLGIPASELRDSEIAATLVWGAPAARLEELLRDASPAVRLELLSDAIALREAQPDPLALVAARRLAVRGARVADVASQLGVSERQLHRRMLSSVGYGPKMLARIARMRRLVAGTQGSLAARAFAAGYANQAHMTEELRRLTGTTPVRFLKDAALTAA